MKILIGLITLSLLLIGCMGPAFPEEGTTQPQIKTCEQSEECIPVPGCHPSKCINMEYKDNFKEPEMCTLQFEIQAAYSNEDCICLDNTCTNKNANRTMEEYEAEVSANKA